MNYENILVQQENGLGTITINRPKKLNALNKATISELHQAFDTLNNDHNTYKQRKHMDIRFIEGPHNSR